MAMLDIFRNRAFSTTSLTNALNKVPFVPSGIGALNLFAPVPVRTKTIAVEALQGKLTIIKTSPRGAPRQERVNEKRNILDLRTTRLYAGDRIMADELQDVRAFGSETELMQVQTEVARRLSGPTGLMTSIEATWELHRLGAIQGKLLDSDGSVIYNYFTQFGITEPAAIDFDLAAKTEGTLRPLCSDVVRAVSRAAQGMFRPGAKIYAACGDDFWDALLEHPDVKQTYLNWAAAADLRRETAWSSMTFGGIEWSNYRGTDDGSTIAIPAGECRFFTDAPGVFQVAWSPAETMGWVNTPGQPVYARTIPDRDRDEWVDIEVMSYPLFLCTMPETLQKGTL